MAAQIVVGLFGALGTAEDARNRLRTVGFAEKHVALRLLREISPRPPTMDPETSDFAIDVIFRTTVPGDELRSVYNGETALCVRVDSDADAENAIDTMRQYAPLKIERLEPAAAAAFLRELLSRPSAG
jgi:hypothetical protein